MAVVVLAALWSDGRNETVEPRGGGQEPLFGQQVSCVLGMLLLLLLKYTAHEIKKLPAALNLAADQASTKGKLIFLVGLEGAEVEGWHFGDGRRERVEKRVHDWDVVFEKGGHLVHGDAEEEQAVEVGLTARGGGHLEKAADAGLADAKKAVETEAVVAAALATVAPVADDVTAIAAARFKIGNYLGADRNALTSLAGTATDTLSAVGICDGIIIRWGVLICGAC